MQLFYFSLGGKTLSTLAVTSVAAMGIANDKFLDANNICCVGAGLKKITPTRLALLQVTFGTKKYKYL